MTERATAEPPEPAESAAWLDDGAIVTDWPPPVSESPTSRRVPGWAIWTAGLLVLALLGLAVWAAGGFGKRTDLLRPTAPGTVVSTGPYELTFIEATAQADLDEQGKVEKWEIVVLGSGRTTGDKSESPSAYGGDGMFAARNGVSGEIQPADGATFGARGDFDQRAFTPGLPPVRYALIFRFSATYQPNDFLRLAVSELEFTANYLTSEEKFWNNGTRGYRFELPVRVLEPKEY